MRTTIIASIIFALSLTYVNADNVKYKYSEKYKKKQDKEYRFFKDKGDNDDDYENKKDKKHKKTFIKQNQLYIEECASCHMAYQAQFLPKRSWNKMMDNLENHFEADASLDENDIIKLKTYLYANASDSKKSYGEIGEFADSINKNSTPLAISSLPKFIREHDEISKKLITQKEVKTISNCTACHRDANEGLYRERNIIIPNYGRWDD